METVERFIDTQIVYSNYWIHSERPEVAGRQFIEAIFYLHYACNNLTGLSAWRSYINLLSILRVASRIYCGENVSKKLMNVLEGRDLYDNVHFDVLRRFINTSTNMYEKIIYGLLHKSLILHKPDTSLIPNRDEFISDLMIILSKSRKFNIICNPDSEIQNNQYGASEWFDRNVNKLSTYDYYLDATKILMITDTIVLSYMKRTTKFKELFPSVRKIQLRELYD